MTPPTTGSKPTVLLVDDDTRTLNLIGAVLDAQGLEVTLSASPTEAIRLLRDIRFDAVVTDVVFDGFSDGQKVLTATRELQPSAVVILMTGYPAVEGAVTALKGGALDYLQKPVDPVVLAAFIQRSLRERQMRAGPLEFLDLVDVLSDMVATTIERVDPYTAGHGERTRKYSRILAERMGLEPERRERLELAAIAHDYGKIYLDDLGFLTKNGPLTPDEYKEVQRHPALGAEKLGNHPHLEEVCKYVAEHHEKWDGTGYPNRLKHDDISMPGRILCIVEVFDSLSTKRSYKEAWSLQKTIDFFEAQSGRAFEPEVLNQFLKLLEVHGEEWITAPQRDLERAGLMPAAQSGGES